MALANAPSIEPSHLPAKRRTRGRSYRTTTLGGVTALLGNDPGLIQRWRAFSKQLTKWCKTRGSIHYAGDGFTVEHPGSDLPYLQLVGYDNYEKSVYFSASWESLVGTDLDSSRASLLPAVKQYGVSSHIIRHEDGSVTLEWWGYLDPAIACAVAVLDFLEFEPSWVADTYLQNPRVRPEKPPELQEALAGLVESAKSLRAAERASGRSGGMAGLIAQSNGVAEYIAQEELEQQHRNRPAPPPDPQPYGVSHEGAEHLAAAWLRHLGALDAEVTRLSGDGGIDVESERYVAQVKNYAGTVPVEELRALHGVASIEGKRAILLTSGSLTIAAAEFADRAGIIVLHYDAISATLTGLNDLGVIAVADGLEGQ